VHTVPTPREQLADKLREARISAGYDSHAALAAKLNVSRPVVSKAENLAQPVPSDAVLAAWAGLTGAPLGELQELANRVRSGTPEWFMRYIAAEAGATRLRCWAPIVVPGLLQCESYAREVIAAEPYAPEQLDGLVVTRMQRQQVLKRARLTAVIDGSVLRRCMGSPAIMAEQCAFLADAAERPNIAVHIVPEGTNTGVWGALDIASRDGLVTVCLTTALDDVTTTEARQADKGIEAFERILGSAMPRVESLEFVRTHEQQWKDQA
jgi:transcriptional regulator with XRE-family HTH domain